MIDESYSPQHINEVVKDFLDGPTVFHHKIGDENIRHVVKESGIMDSPEMILCVDVEKKQELRDFLEVSLRKLLIQYNQEIT